MQTKVTEKSRDLNAITCEINLTVTEARVGRLPSVAAG